MAKKQKKVVPAELVTIEVPYDALPYIGMVKKLHESRKIMNQIKNDKQYNKAWEDYYKAQAALENFIYDNADDDDMDF